MLDNLFATTVNMYTKYGHLFWYGLKITLQLSAISVFCGVLVGSLICLMKRSRFAIFRFRPVSFLATAYIEIIRGTPLLLQLYFFYFLLPMFFPFFEINKFAAVCVALILNDAGYVSEIIRAGIEAVDKGQVEAARSLGLGRSQTMIRIVMPQAVRNILPALCNEFVMVIKETSLASTFFVGDIMTQVKSIQGFTYQSIQPLIIAAILYFGITFPLSKIVALIERRMKASD